MIILDEKMQIDGYTESGQINSNLEVFLNLNLY